jgi:hypothetical protein
MHTGVCRGRDIQEQRLQATFGAVELSGVRVLGPQRCSCIVGTQQPVGSLKACLF